MQPLRRWHQGKGLRLDPKFPQELLEDWKACNWDFQAEPIGVKGPIRGPILGPILI